REAPHETLAHQAFTHGNSCLAAGQFADAIVAFQGTHARADASACRWPARRSGTAAACGACHAARQCARLSRRPRAMGAGGMARGPVAGGDLRSVQTLEQEEASVARLEVAHRTQALVDQASRAAEKE